MRIGRFDIEPFQGQEFWLGRDSLFESNLVLVKMSTLTDPYVYSEARLISQIGSEAPFKLGDIFLDDAQRRAGYVLVLPGPVETLEQALSAQEVIEIAKRLGRGLLTLHRAHIAYRNFGRTSFLVSTDHAIPHDFSRAARIRQEDGSVCAVQRSEEIAEQNRAPADYDPPEAKLDRYDGVKGDIYGLGVLFREIGLGQVGYGWLIDQMMLPQPEKRPASVDAVLTKL